MDGAFALVMLVLIPVGCVYHMVKPTEVKEYTTDKGIVCRSYESDFCGMKLWDCTDGKTYQCQTNLELKVSKRPSMVGKILPMNWSN